MSIHPTSVIDRRAELGDNVEIGPFVVVGADVILHEGVELLAHSVVMGPCELGAGCRVFPGAIIGMEPQDSKYRGEKSLLVVGAHTVFREGATAHRGTDAGRGKTRIGERCLFLANSHVAHDCLVGDGVVFANSAAIAGHCEVGDKAQLGGLVGLHQNTRVGRLAMLGAGTMASQDVPPFMLAQGDRARLLGPNLVGLRRAGFSAETIDAIGAAFRVLFQEGLPVSEALEALEAAPPASPEVAEIVAFIRSSRRGVARIDRSAPDPIVPTGEDRA